MKIPTPFKYQFAAGRRPGGKPDRYVDSQGDEHGTIKGSYTYLDPNYKWQRVRSTKDFILTIIFISFFNVINTMIHGMFITFDLHV